MLIIQGGYMPEEQNQAPAPADPVAAAPANPQTAPAAGGKAPKKSNGCMIAIIVVAVIVVLTGIGIFVAYKFVKNKVTSTINTDNGSTTINLGDNKGSVSNSGDSYEGTTDQKPTVDIVKNADNDLKPIFTSLFGGAKTNSWSSVDTSSGSLGYITKNKVTANDYAKIKDKLTTAGYTSSSDYNSSSGSMITVTKADITITIFLNTDDQADTIVVTVSQQAPETDASTE